MKAERQLPAYLAAANPTLPASCWPGASQRISAGLDRYARQYLGIASAGRRLLYINCFPVGYPDWRTHLVDVEDGGESFFHLIYDPELDKFSDLTISGQA